MPDRAYNAGSCANPVCRRDLGFIEAGGGRTRQYCDDRCRKAAARARAKDAKRDQAEKDDMQARRDLRAELVIAGFDGRALDTLMSLAVEFGIQVAREAAWAAYWTQEEGLHLYRPTVGRSMAQARKSSENDAIYCLYIVLTRNSGKCILTTMYRFSRRLHDGRHSTYR